MLKCTYSCDHYTHFVYTIIELVRPVTVLLGECVQQVQDFSIYTQHLINFVNTKLATISVRSSIVSLILDACMFMTHVFILVAFMT